MNGIIDWLDDHLVDNWRQAKGWLSVQLGSVFMALCTGWPFISDDIKLTLLGYVGLNGPVVLAGIGFAAVIYARLRAGKAKQAEVAAAKAAEKAATQPPKA